jgi:ubiquinone/menaquinone biosynthesis C-methylase UbiE
MARNYVLRRITIDPSWKVLDIGPGTLPLVGPRVWYLDYDETMLDDLPEERCICANLNQLPLPIRDQEFDFVYCSHVMEHVEDPVAFAAELTRIGRRGVVVTPHAFKDSMFQFEDHTHRWWFFPPVAPEAPMRAMRADPELIRSIKDVGAQVALMRVYRTEPQVSCDHEVLNRWFKEHEPDLDVIVPWEGKLCVEVIG